MSDEARYPFVVVDATPDAVDELSGALFSLGATGVEERDETTLAKGKGAGKVTLVASFGSREDADEAIAEMNELDASLGARIEEVVGDAWRDAWKEHFAPFALTKSITVVPPWVEYEKRADESILVLEPGRAFGTGLHATTSLVAEGIEEALGELEGKTVLDLGCGSGILALVALKHGAKKAIAVDVDEDVIEIVRENAERNGLADKVEASAGTVDAIKTTYPWVFANIEARVLLPIADKVAGVVAAGGTLILSGILASEEKAIIERYTSTSKKLVYRSTRRRGEAAGESWVAITLTAP
jgi:ribosomal protein L11 methyltransferase